MKVFTTTGLLILLAVLLGVPSHSLCADSATVQVEEAEGSAAVSGADLARARNEAIRDALQKAVAQVAGHWLSLQDTEQKSQILQERILDRAEGFIQDYRVVSESTLSEIYTVVIRASVFAETLRDELRKAGLIDPAQPRSAVNRIFLTVRGIRQYGDYKKVLGLLREGVPGIRGAILREASWGVARFEVASDVTTTALSESLREKLALDVGHQDEQVLEVHLIR